MIGPAIIYWAHAQWARCQPNPQPRRPGWHYYTFTMRNGDRLVVCRWPWYLELNDGWVQIDGGPPHLPPPPDRRRK